MLFRSGHYSGPGGQLQLSTADLVARISADSSGNHMIWKNGFSAWKSWREVPEIAGQLPAAPPPPPSAAATYHYNGAAGQSVMTVDQIVAAVRANPSGAHHVWQTGWPGWKKPAEVPEIASHLGPPPPPPT